LILFKEIVGKLDQVDLSGLLEFLLRKAIFGKQIEEDFMYPTCKS